MQVLLDTHALIWWLLGDPQLSAAAREAIANEEVFVSAVSAYKIANKVRAGKLEALRSALDQYDQVLRDDGFAALTLSAEHARRAGLLVGRHRDPFDRMIAAQALSRELTVVTRDPELSAFGCEVLW